MVKGRQGERVRLYVKGTVLGYKRSPVSICEYAVDINPGDFFLHFQTKNVAVDIDCILNCDSESIPTHFPKADGYLHLPIVNSKVDRFSLLKSLPSALNFAKLNLNRGKTLLICCGNGEDISICVCLAIISSLFDDGGMFDDGNYFRDACITKGDLRRRLISICQFAANARPSRGNLKQVFCFLNRDKTSSVS